MKSVVCIKRVADTEARIRVAGDGVSVDPTGVKFILNPYDEFAIEAALRLKETAGGGEVTVLSVGPKEAAETLRSGLAMGADQGVLVGADGVVEGIAVARLIAAELRERSFDLALFGMKAIDDDLQAVGSMVAELLDLPGVMAVSEFSVVEGLVTARREVEGGAEIVALPTPCILTITKGAYEPRYPSLKGIMAAKKKPLEEKVVGTPESGTMRIRSLRAPPERKPGRIVGEGADAVPELVRLLREEAGAL